MIDIYLEFINYTWFTGLLVFLYNYIIHLIDLFYRTEKIVTMPVKGTEYHDGMNPEGRFQLYISGKNIDSGSMESTQISFVLKKPQLVIQVQTHITISDCDRQGFFPEHIAAGNIFFVPARYGKYFLVPLGSSNH